MKVYAIGSVLGGQLKVKQANELVPDHACLGKVNSPEDLEAYQVAKRAHKRALKEAANGRG
jgi:hypothetical protein